MYNNLFFGSLESLTQLEKLEYLDIRDTNINSGVEYLPKSLSGVDKHGIKKIFYSANQRPNNKVSEIKDQLDFFTNKELQKKWAELGFDSEESFKWLNLTKIDCNFANYLKNGKNLTPQETKNTLTRLRKEYHQAQVWLDYNYPQEQRTNVKELNINNKELWGECDLKDFTSLEKLNCSNNQLTNLDISNSLKLKELLCQDNQLKDIKFPADAEKLVLERINMVNNNQLNYAKIERSFLKSLPILVKNEIKVIERKELEKIIKERINVPGEIKDILFFSTWWNPNCALVINKVVWYGVRLAVYEPLTEEQEDYKAKLEKQLKTKRQELVAKENEATTLQKELKTLEKNNQEYERNNQHLSDELEELKKELNKLEKENRGGVNEIRKKIQKNQIEKNNKEEKDRKEELKELNQQINNDKQELKQLKSAMQKIEKTRVFKIIKVSEHIYRDKTDKKVEELKEELNGDNPILALYPHNSGFSVDEIMQRTSIKGEELKLAEKEPDKYLKPTDIVWRTMKGMPGCYHVAVYSGNEKVVHIGSSKFVKTSKVKDSKSLLGARSDNWQDFLYDTDKLIRYHLVIPFQRPEKIQEHITKAVLAEHGAESYSFLGNNCEHFATLVVCGIPFSTQADKISMLAHKVYLDLAKEMVESEQEFARMSKSEIFKREFERNKEYKLNEIKELESRSELDEREKQRLISLEKELQELEELQSRQTQTNLSDTSSELSLSTISRYGSTTSLISTGSETSSSNWEKIVKKQTHILGTIEKIIPLETNPNQVLVINKVALYAVRLFEYKDNKLTELKRYAKNKLGYLTLEDALAKVERIKEEKLSQWTNIHSNFTKELITQWTNHNFTFQQVKDWTNAGLAITDASFGVWLRDSKQVDAEWVLNHANEVDLRKEYQEYLNNQLQTQQEIPPKK